MNTMVGQGIVSLMQLGMRYRRAFDDGFIVTEHVALLPDRDSKVAQGETKVNHLVSTDASCYKF